MKVPALHHLVGYVVVIILAGAGSAQALAGTGTVDSGDIRDGQVKRVDIAPSAVNGARVGDNTLTGKDIVESKLGTVPNADKVDGMHAARFTKTYTAAGTTPQALVASVGGLQIYAGCTESLIDAADHDADIAVRSTVNGSTLSISSTTGSGAQTAIVTGFDAGEQQAFGGTTNAGQASLIYSTPAGKVVEVNLAWSGQADAGGTNRCVLHGTLFGG